MDKSAKVFSSEYTVPTKKPKKPIAYPKLEEEKAMIKKIKYICHKCSQSFSAVEGQQTCILCNSDFIEVDDGQQELKDITGSGISGFFSKFVKDASQQFGEIFVSLGDTLSGSVQVAKDIGSGLKPTINRTISELASVKDIVIYRTQRNQNGEEREVEIKLEDTYRPFLLKFGLMDKNNPNIPAMEEDINKLEEIKITEEHYKYNEVTNKMEAPE